MSAVIICGNLSARRPGGERTRKPVRLPAERQRLGAVSNYQSLTRVSRLSADTAGRREVVTDRIRVRRGPAFGGIWKNVRSFRLLNPARISFLGSARVQLRQKSPRCIADSFQVNHSLRDAPASEMQEITGARSCTTQGGSDPTRNRSSV